MMNEKEHLIRLTAQRDIFLNEIKISEERIKMFRDNLELNANAIERTKTKIEADRVKEFLEKGTL